MILAIGGEPATGKTTLVRSIISRLPAGQRVKAGLVVGALHGNVLVLGDGYATGHPFAGTDRLSMAVMPQVQEFLPAFLAGRPGASVLFEGDRLVTTAFLRFCLGLATTCLWVLYAPPDVLGDRHRARNDAQTAVFLRGRATKYKRILEAGLGTLVSHWTAADTEVLAQRALGLLTCLPAGDGSPVAGRAERPA